MEKLLEYLKDELDLLNDMNNESFNTERDEGYFSGKISLIEDIIPMVEKIISEEL